MVSVQRHFTSLKSMYIQNYSYNWTIIQTIAVLTVRVRWERSFNSADGSQPGSECSNLRGRLQRKADINY